MIDNFPGKDHQSFDIKLYANWFADNGDCLLIVSKPLRIHDSFWSKLLYWITFGRYFRGGWKYDVKPTNELQWRLNW